MQISHLSGITWATEHRRSRMGQFTRYNFFFSRYGTGDRMDLIEKHIVALPPCFFFCQSCRLSSVYSWFFFYQIGQTESVRLNGTCKLTFTSLLISKILSIIMWFLWQEHRVLNNRISMRKYL